MFCGDELSVFENALIKNLNEIKTYKLEANHLYFYDTSNRLILFLERQQTEE
jgi:heat shock protein HslJ